MSVLALSLTLVFAAPEPPESSPASSEIADPNTDPEPLEQDPGIAEPSAHPPPPKQPPDDGFGSVTSVTVDSQVIAPPPPQPEDQSPRREMSLRAEIGYGQASLGNTERLDHQGAFLRAHFAFYPWLSKGRRAGLGLGLLYSYQGLNRKQLPVDAGLETSKGQQQEILFSVPTLFRPHPEWFSIQPSLMIGLGFYTGGDFWAADRRATIPRDEYAFTAGGDLALCTAWDIVCLVGGSELLVGIATVATDSSVAAPRIVNPWGWHLGLGLDVLRLVDRGNRVNQRPVATSLP